MKFSLRKIAWMRWGMRLGLASLLLRLVFTFAPSVCETLYSRGLFPLIRYCFDYTTALLPFPTIYLLFIFVVMIVGRALYKVVKYTALKIRKKIDTSWKSLLGQASLSFFNFLGWSLFYFLWIWGYNYARTPLEDQMRLKLEPIDHPSLMAEAEWILQKAPETRALIPNSDTFALTEKHYPWDLEQEMRRLLVKVLDSLDYPTPGCVRGRYLYPKGTLYRFGASGIYMPFVGEGHIDAALHPSQQPFTMAHELAHGYGFGDEAECNFLGFLACMASDAPAIRYSGYLAYWRYVFSELKFMDYGCYKELRALVQPGMYNDLEAIYATGRRYPEFFPYLQDLAYELYLQSQGVKEGIRSYDKMVLFVVAYGRK